MQIVLIISCLLAGASIALIVSMIRNSRVIKESEAKYNESERERSVIGDRLQQSLSQVRSLESTLDAERKLAMDLNAFLAGEKANVENLREKLENQKKELESVHQRLTAEFENLSSKILEEKSKKFTEQNRNNLDIILNPLKEKIKEFELKVEQSYKIESAERNSLKGEIKNLFELNRQLSDEANNLVRALKGDTKKQGNWGEYILERILERSGLTKGSEYDIQYNTSNEAGQRIQPDVIINLPDNKHIIVDAKVSLIAYEAFVNAESEDDRAKYLKDHIASVRNHIKILSEKAYYTSTEINAPDFVLIFMPIEPSFGIAIQADADLFSFAWDRKIVLVSPSTLLATLQTVSAIWKHEKQNRNAIEIARVGGSLYDKFYNFLKDMENVSDKLRLAQKSHEDAMNKLSTGAGNLIKRVEDLKKLGAKATKDISLNYLESAEENDATAEIK